MVRKEVKDKEQVKYLDKVNTERKGEAQKNVATAINILKRWSWSTSDDKEALVKDAARSVNLLEAAEQDMEWHCEWFDYNNDICFQINDACVDLGGLMAEDEEDDIEMLKANVTDALVKLSKALATLIRWDESY